MAVFILSLVASLALTQHSIADENVEWSFDASFQHYFLPGEDDLSIPSVSLTGQHVMLEARHNYESRDATSIWLGVPFSFTEPFDIELIPMIGGVFNSIHGMAPGLVFDASWERWNAYSELEYVFDFDTRDNNFFYSWSEVTFSVLERIRVGIVGSRTRAYDSSVELDRGPIIAFDYERVTLSCTALNVDDSAIVILGVDVSL